MITSVFTRGTGPDTRMSYVRDTGQVFAVPVSGSATSLANVGARPLIFVAGNNSTVQGTPATSVQNTPVIAGGSLSGSRNYSWIFWAAVLGACWLFSRKK